MQFDAERTVFPLVFNCTIYLSDTKHIDKLYIPSVNFSNYYTLSSIAFY